METTYTIKRITKSDEPFLWEMLYHALYVPDGKPPFPREILSEPEIKRYVENWGMPDDVGFIARDGDKPIGAVWLRKFSEDNQGFGFVSNATPELSIAILPDYRNKGIGTALLNRIFELASEWYEAISLSVSLENPAYKLYERAGFQVVKKTRDSATMLKYLKSNSPKLPAPDTGE